MKIPRNTNLLIEPPSVATGDIAFNLLVFFLVCASAAPDSGRRQEIPRAEKDKQQQAQSKNVEVSITRNAVSVGEEGTGLQEVKIEELPSQLQRLLSGKAKPEDRIVVVKSTKDTPYHRWIVITNIIEQAGGTITLQLSDEKETVVP